VLGLYKKKKLDRIQPRRLTCTRPNPRSILPNWFVAHFADEAWLGVHVYLWTWCPAEKQSEHTTLSCILKDIDALMIRNIRSCKVLQEDKFIAELPSYWVVSIFRWRGGFRHSQQGWGM